MSSKKHGHTRKEHSLPSLLRPITFTVTAIVVASFAFIAHDTPTKHIGALTKRIVNVPAPAPRQQSTPLQTSSVPSPPKSVVAPAVSPKSTTRVLIPQGGKQEPVVMPAPSSSVSSLTPVATSSSGSSTSSSNSAPATTTGYTSANWSGYMATTGNFTAISGSWTVPSVTGPPGVTSADSAWIGIGGVSSGDLIQVGTQDTVSPTGRSSSSAFYELLPESSTIIPAIAVSTGDHMSASLIETASNEWTITITDTTNGQSFVKNVGYISSNSSAEWIEEDPSYTFRRQIPFDNFGEVTFSGSSTTNGSSVSISGSSAQPVTMLSASGTPIATPSGLSGDNFSVARDE